MYSNKFFLLFCILWSWISCTGLVEQLTLFWSKVMRSIATHRQSKRAKLNLDTVIRTPGERSLLSVKLCVLTEKVVTLQKGVNNFFDALLSSFRHYRL